MNWRLQVLKDVSVPFKSKKDMMICYLYLFSIHSAINSMANQNYLPVSAFSPCVTEL